MRTAIKFGTGLALALAFALPAAAKDKTGPTSASIAWARSYGDAVQEANERNVPIFLHSHAAT